MRNLFGEEFCPPDNGKSTGCQNCPLNYIEGLHKIKGLERIQKRKGFLWAQSPGARENEQKLELVGLSGQLVWNTLKPLGLSRNDFDIRNVLSCRPLDDDGKHEHQPTKRELRCCSVFNEEALERNGGAAAVHLILGDVAGKQLLKKHYKKDNPLFWHEPWGAYVILAPHPAYILRQGGVHADSWAYADFKERFKATAACMRYPGRWGYVKSLDSGAVQGTKQVLWLEQVLHKEAEAGRRVAVDIEDGMVDGKRTILMVGFGWGEYTHDHWDGWKGTARSVVLDHPQARYPHERNEVVATLKRILENPKIRKCLQHGSYDVDRLRELLGITTQGYDYDTQYAAYLYNSNLRRYGLERLARYWFSEFMEYKEMVAPWKTNLAEAPLETLVIYNSADCHLTKRVELKTASHISYPLLQIYIQDAFVLDSMQGRGPILDRQAHKRLMDAVPQMMEPLENQLKEIAEDQSFNPGSPSQIAKLIYDKLELEPLEGEGRSTKEEVLQTIALRTGAIAPLIVLKWRALHTIQSTFLVGFQRGADEHGGELRTIWHLSGANTGRLRSGGGEETELRGITNFQNLHGSPLIKNLLVSDLNWRDALNAWPLEALKNLYVFVALDYSQLEIRFLAAVSGDKLLKKQLNDGRDIHCLVGHLLTGADFDTIKKDKELRRSIKEFHFSLVYGVSKPSMYGHLIAKGVKITRQRAEQYYDRYFQYYTGVRDFIVNQRTFAEQHGYVETIFGFRSHISKNDESRNTYWGNQAINRPIQGAAHQMLLIAMALLKMKPRTYQLLHWAKSILMEVHDALYFRVRLGDLMEAHAVAQKLFEQDITDYVQRHFKIDLGVPLLAEAEAGFCMGSMVEYTGQPIEAFLAEWRTKHLEIESRPLERLMPELKFGK